MELLRDTLIRVDLGALAYNMDLIREMCGPDCAVMPVIKANGYGHGAVGIAPTLMEHGAAYLAVATLTEALELREAYPNYPLFILGHTPDRLLPLVVEKRITQTIFSEKQALLLADAAAKLGKEAKCHLKVDTGFHRLGTCDVEELDRICRVKGLTVEGIFSHLALASDEENRKQFDCLMGIIAELEKRGHTFRYKHIADSISGVDYPEYRLNMIRPGALVFGLRGFHIRSLDVRQAISFESRISQIHELKEGEGVGYDYVWRAPKATRVATVPVGYADGYPRQMRDKGYLTVRGVRCPVIGIICMDQLMIDLTHCPEAEEGDLCLIYGDGTHNEMSIPEAAALLGTNKNDVICRLTARPPRIYAKG